MIIFLKRLFTDVLSGCKKYLTDRLPEYKKYLTDILSGYKKYLTDILSGYNEHLTDILTGTLPGYQKYLTARVPRRTEGHIYVSLIISIVLLTWGHHQSTNSIICNVQSYHTPSVRWLAWSWTACGLPCCGRYQGPAWWLLAHLSQSYLYIFIYSATSHILHYLC